MISVAEGGIVELRILGGPFRGEAVPGLVVGCCVPEPGEEVLANTVGIEMGLGTGGVAFIAPGCSSWDTLENRNHFIKLPYTPLQFPAPPPEQAAGLEGVPVAVLPLHSHLAPACCAAAVLRPGARVAFVWQEGGALSVPFSRMSGELNRLGLLHTVVSCGSCFGGDIEAPNIYSGLLAGAADADLVLVGIGPGVVGTATTYGHGGMAAALALNAAVSLGAEPVLAPRISFADQRKRHRGLSHHVLAVLQTALAGCRVALPESASGSFDHKLADKIPERHVLEPVSYGAAGLEERFGVTFESMGRGYTEDPAFFDAAAAAVALSLGAVREESS